MTAPNNQRVRRGFTLVEILIVVIILGILASIVIPQFSNASDDAKQGSMRSSLRALRGQIELYMLQHGNAPPALTGSDWTPLVDTSTFGGTQVGPYVSTLPSNPLNGYTDVLAVTADQLGGADVGSPNIGFVYNGNNGKIWATNRAGDKVFNELDPNDPNN